MDSRAEVREFLVSLSTRSDDFRTRSHDATPDAFMEHLAMLEKGDGSDATDGWFEHVIEEHYRNATEV